MPFIDKILKEILEDSKSWLPLETYKNLELAFRNPSFREIFGAKINEILKETTTPGDLKCAMSEFHSLIENENTTEREMQLFFENQPWFLGFEYAEVVSQKRAGYEHILDFRIRDTSDRYDIVELKRPSDRLFKKYRKGLTMTQPLVNALSQLQDYLDFYFEHGDYVYSTEGKRIYKPRGVLLMGRSIPEERTQLMRQNSFLDGIEIRTYDMVFERMERISTALSELSL
ncbi:MAG: DUF4263 domain-containing protein [Candidatus Methanofastidiosia archaeon]|jgi:hypothetical protein